MSPVPVGHGYEEDAQLMMHTFDADWDIKGARVLTNMSNTYCPRCAGPLAANVEHLCGDRVPKMPKTKPEGGATPGRRKKQNTPGVRK